MAKRTPEFRDCWTTRHATIWRDRRNGASAINLNTLDGVTKDYLKEVFTGARSNGIVVDRKHPLIVYGTHSLIGETETFKFIQMDTKALADLDDEIFQATCSTAVAS